MKTITLFEKLNNIDNKRIKALLYSSEEDFIVQEINSKGKFFDINKKELNFPQGSQKDFVKIILVKKGISTFQAVSELADFLRIKKEDIKYHGLKDTFGITSQEISIPTKRFLESFNKIKETDFKDFFIKEAIFINKQCQLREIKGNRFLITLREPEEGALKKFKNLKLIKIPNFYGHQRFGVRQNTPLVGKYLIKRDYSNALKIFCTDSKNESKKIKDIRNKIKTNWNNWDKCIELTKNNPQLKNEYKIFKQLSITPKDYIKALNEIGITLFCVNSFSSYLFNKVLYNLLKDKKEVDSLPVVGYKTKFKETGIEKIYSNLLSKENINLSDFFNKDYPELSYPGRDRVAFYTLKNFSYQKKDPLIILEFNLPMGVYANLFLEKIIKNKSGRNKLE